MQVAETDGGEVGDVGDGGADDEGDGPVDGDEADPKVFICPWTC